jgi:hypothetical protein
LGSTICTNLSSVRQIGKSRWFFSTHVGLCMIRFLSWFRGFLAPNLVKDFHRAISIINKPYFFIPNCIKILLNFYCISFDNLLCWETFSQHLRIRIHEEGLKYQGEHSQLPLQEVKKIFVDYSWWISLEEIPVGFSVSAHLPIIFRPSDDSSMLQRYTNLVYNLSDRPQFIHFILGLISWICQLLE